jgi:hypothetical protein
MVGIVQFKLLQQFDQLVVLVSLRGLVLGAGVLVVVFCISLITEVCLNR